MNAHAERRRWLRRRKESRGVEEMGTERRLDNAWDLDEPAVQLFESLRLGFSFLFQPRRTPVSF